MWKKKTKEKELQQTGQAGGRDGGREGWTEGRGTEGRRAVEAGKDKENENHSLGAEPS